MDLFMRGNITKVIIFDFDGTLYHIDGYEKIYFKYAKKALANILKISNESSELLMNKYGITESSSTSVSISDIIKQIGVNNEVWNNYRDSNTMIIDFTKAEHITMEFIMRFRSKYKVYLVTNKTLKVLNEYFFKMQLDLSIFDGVIPRDSFLVKDFESKGDIFKYIKNMEECDYSEMISIGDKYKVDLLPMISLGGNAIKVEKFSELEKIALLLGA